MAFEREAMSDTPTTVMPEMREERIVTPYEPRINKMAGGTTETPKIGQSDKGESASPEAPPGQTVESVTLSPAAAALARKEQSVRQKEQSLKDREKALETEREELAKLRDLKKRLEAKDYSGVEEIVKYDEYTNYLIEKEQGKDPRDEAVKALATKVDDLEKNHKTDIDKRFEAAVNDRRRAVQGFIDSDPTFSKVKALKMSDSSGKELSFTETVVQHILDTWSEDSVDLSPEQAAKEVKELLLDKAKRWSEIVENATTTPTDPEAKPLPPLKAGVKTLTNNATVTGEIKAPRKSFQGMSDEERWAEARRRAEEKLKAR